MKLSQPTSSTQGSIAIAASRMFSTATIESWWVQIPARLDRYSSLLSDAWSDGIYLTVWPRIAILLPLTSLVFGFVEGASHWSFLTIGENAVSSSISVVAFAQVLPLVVIGAVVGSLSANAGLMLVLGYALGDFLFAGPQVPFNGGPWLPSFFYTRPPMLLSYVLFLMLAVLPIVSTKRLLTDLYRRMPGRDIASTLVRIAATAGVQGLFIYIWIFVAPMVMRTLWQWPVHSYYGAPVAIGYFHQLLSPWLEIAAMGAIVVRGWLTVRAERNPEVATRVQKLESMLETAEDVPLFPERLRWLRALLSALLMMLLVSGFIDSIWLGLVMMAVFAAPLLAREYLFPTSSIWMKWTTLVLKVPAVLRLAAAGLGSYLITLTLLAIFPGQAPARNGAGGAFGVELTSLGFGLLVLVALLPPETTASTQDSEAQAFEIPQVGRNEVTRTAARIVFPVALLVLFTVPKAYASCRDPYCCCAGDSNLCALATAGFPPLWAPVMGGLPRKRRKKKKDCSGLEEAYKNAKSLLDTIDAQIQDVADKYNNDLKKLQDLDSQAKSVQDEAMSELKEIAILEAGSLVISAIADIVTSLLIEATTATPMDPIAKYVYVGPPNEGIEVPPVSFGFDVIEKFGTMYKFWTSQAQGLNTDAYRELATEYLGYPGIGDASALFTLCRLLDEMNSLLAKMDLLMDRYDQLLVERKPLAEKAAKAKAAWEQCIREGR
jgi:hypothetical protein